MTKRIIELFKSMKTPELRRLRELNYEAYLQHQKNADRMWDIIQNMDDELATREHDKDKEEEAKNLAPDSKWRYDNWDYPD